ncbi:MAG TPA: M67 family metallopeptidase [Solirubrobacteraceae bacterium]|jgi:proteasome lid subunit RPN8/RPN11|nr:M67 family metallopeptidase [Solirubrobacteraceae bacterium]
MRISRELLDALVAHALEDPGNEVCGVVATDAEEAEPDGGQPAAGDQRTRAVRVLRATNVHASPLRFEIDPRELLGLYLGIEADGHALGAIYHSHVRSRPYPSQTDINFAANWPGVEWIIVGLAAGKDPEVRSYLIDAGEVREVALEVA